MSRSDILSLFEKYGILSTPQRLEVAEILLEKPQHMSADQIIDRLRDAGSSVSKATVYNTLNQVLRFHDAPASSLLQRGHG
jgi:Fur family iron response transcriptional regulator